MATSTRVVREQGRRYEEIERDRRYEQLVELSPDAILVHDGERIVSANAAALRLAGASRPNELVGRSVAVVLNPPYLRGVQHRLLDESGTEAYTAPVRDTLRRLDGSSVAVEVRAVVFVDHGLPAAHLVIRDITERLAFEETARRVEERLQKAQRVEAVGALAGGVAHELNNMIAIILGHAAFVLDDRTTGASVLSDVREIIKAAERAAAVTRQLLDFSRHAITRPEVIELSQKLRDTESALRGLLGPSRHLDLELAGNAYANVDSGQVDQVILSLVTNARDATASDGHVVISTGTIAVTEPIPSSGGQMIPPGRYSVLAVRDDGEGIDPLVRPRVFEPFFTTKPLGEGIGLGLAAVQGILNQNGGYITVSSELGVGSTFTIYLPEVGGIAQLASLIATTPSVLVSTDRRSVLIVDDEPALRAVAARVLQIAGLHVTTAANGADALALIEKDGPPELVLTDLRMPGMGGIELKRQINARWPNTSVLLMTGYSAEYLQLDGIITADDELLQKPYTAETLVAQVQTVLALTPPAGTATVE